MSLVWIYSGIFVLLSYECGVLEKGSRAYLAGTVVGKLWELMAALELLQESFMPV